MESALAFFSQSGAFGSFVGTKEQGRRKWEISLSKTLEA